MISVIIFGTHFALSKTSCNFVLQFVNIHSAVHV